MTTKAGDRRNDGESNCNSGDGTGQMAQPWMFMMMNIIIILGISFMQGIYTYIPETNHVPREHCVATILM